MSRRSATSAEEWSARNRSLAAGLGELIERHLARTTGRGLDVGCQNGALTSLLAKRIDLEWAGVDPQIEQPITSPDGIPLHPGWAHDLPFASESFDCAVLANVYEHIDPDLRGRSLAELYRVLAPGGILVGQLPNPYFPVESHTRLPFLGWLPAPARRAYWRFARVPWRRRHPPRFHAVTVGHLRRTARAAGFRAVEIRGFNYPPESVPRRLRWAARALAAPMRLYPWSWQFVFQRPAVAGDPTPARP